MLDVEGDLLPSIKPRVCSGHHLHCFHDENKGPPCIQSPWAGLAFLGKQALGSGGPIWRLLRFQEDGARSPSPWAWNQFPIKNLAK